MIIRLLQIPHDDTALSVDSGQQMAVRMDTHVRRYDLLLVVIEGLGWLVLPSRAVEDVPVAEVPDFYGLVS